MSEWFAAPAPLLPEHVLHEVFGTVLVGSWFASMIFALSVVLFIRYWTRFATDVLWFRILMSFMMVVDLVGLIGFYAMAYMYMVTGWGDVVSMATQNATYPIYFVAQLVRVASMHSFLIYRYFALSRNLIVTIVLTILALSAVVTGCFLTWALNKYTAISQRGQLNTIVTIWFACSLSSDILTTLALLIQLARIKSTFQRTKSLINRLMGMAIASGGVTACFATASLIAFLTRPTTNISVMLGACIGHSATLTVAFNLVDRKSTAENGSSANNSIPLETKTPAIGIRVHQMSIVVDPGSNDFESGSFDHKAGRRDEIV